MVQAVPMVVSPSNEESSNMSNNQEIQSPSFHLQTTTIPNGSDGVESANKDISTQYQKSGISFDTPTITRTPQDTSPDKLSPQTTGSKLQNIWKTPKSSRLKETRSGEESPLGAQSATPLDLENQLDASRPPVQNRKSVQFSRDAEEPDTSNNIGTRTPADEDKLEAAKSTSLYSKLRALATSQSFSHTRSASTNSLGGRSADGRDQDGSTTPRNRNEYGLEATLEEDGSDADADAEESAAEGVLGQSSPRKRRRKNKRTDNLVTAPSSPLTLFNSGQMVDSPHTSRPSIFRRATDTDMARQGLSEDEGRRQLPGAWTPRHPLRGLSYGGQRKNSEPNLEAKDTRRPLGLLNLGNVASHRTEGGAETDGDGTPKVSRRKQLTTRGTSLSAAKWRQIKNSLKLIGQGRTKRPTQDQQKSAELLAELAAGGPAALMIASMFQRDEHGSKRIPILLEQLKVSITDSDVVKYKEAGNPGVNDRHIVFRLELEYGNGINRMRWVVRRSLADFASLHAKYKLHLTSERLKGRNLNNNKKLPRFPREAFPYIKTFRWYKDLEDEEGEEDFVNETDANATDTEGRPPLSTHRSRASLGMLNIRRASIGSQADLGPQTPGGSNSLARRDIRYGERQRKKLEKYLQSMIQFMLFRPDANRLCKFLEVSALGMRLAAEGSYHGKEGFMVIRSAKGLDFRKALTPTNVKLRHTPKWFLVRHSYIVCVDSPEGMNIYDVFLFDSDFRIQSTKLRKEDQEVKDPKSAKTLAQTAKETAKHPQHHRLKVWNSERKLKLIARNERQLDQFEESMKLMVDNSPWTKQNRFDSFAPVRPNCFAQWLVDGRDHMWVVSRALHQAKDVIYIHDWWLSPEIYMRRPPAISQKWRLDRLLKQKAEEGVKVFVIVYRNIDAAIPIDSQYTKFSLLDLHPNIFVQRSPNQFRQNTFFWAHHEKLVIVDHTLAFVGGIDLCFGRWDTPQHVLTDDKPTGFDASQLPKDADHCQLWPGKDYSNPRIQDFNALNKPYEEMYDRSQIARMPWHDISMQVVGQPARDLTRHFVQRWNYILRQRKPTRPTPFLLPPPDFNAADLEALGLDGTCEVQILRSSGPWSMGTPDKTEHSIMNAYVKMIEESEHFVYMENQFFITSCETEGATVYNKIGDALVERIVRAAKAGDHWRAVIVIPLIPGFQNTVEQEGGTSVRLIMQYQFRSICRGESSIFGRLKSEGIEPEDYIQFYSLRQWGKIGPRQSLVTEQLYIHAKCIIVDDRVALIGSANVNERSMLGNRDSECAAIVRDTDMFWSSMNGKPYRVSRFAYSLRMRLMREHLGLDTDQIMEEAQLMENEHQKHTGKLPDRRPNTSGHDADGDVENERDDEVNPLDRRGKEIREELLTRSEKLSSFNHDVDWEQADNPNLRANRKRTEDSRITRNATHKADVDGEGFDNMTKIQKLGYGVGRDTALTRNGKEVLINEVATEDRRTLSKPRPQSEHIRMPSYVVKKEAPEPPLPPRPSVIRQSTDKLGLPQTSTLPALPILDDSDIGGPGLVPTASRGSGSLRHPLFGELKKAMIDRDCMQDPVHETFIDDIWHHVAENNTKIYRAVFRCMPDNQVRDWHEYHQYMAYAQRFNQLQGNDVTDDKVAHAADKPVSRTGPPGVGAGTAAATTKIKGLSKVPTDIEKGATFVKDKVKGAVDQDGEDKNAAEKAALRNWAAEANRLQMQRTGTDLSVRRAEKATTLNEKSGLLPVPEHDQPPTRSSDGSETQRVESSHSGTSPEKPTSSDATYPSTPTTQGRRRRRGTTRSSRREFNASDDILGLVEAEELLGHVQGRLIEWPYDWLEKVEAGSNWLFPFDQISPIEIYI